VIDYNVRGSICGSAQTVTDQLAMDRASGTRIAEVFHEFCAFQQFDNFIKHYF